MAFMGMNPAQMRTFETSLDAEAKRVRAVISRLDGRVAKVDWRGPDAIRRPAANWRSWWRATSSCGRWPRPSAFNRSARRLAEPAEHEITNQTTQTGARRWRIPNWVATRYR